MAEAKRYAVVTGANKGIGFEVCRQLACKRITVVLTARDEKRGLDALHKLKEDSSHGFPAADRLLFHQLDVSDSSSVASLAEFIRAQFGRLDILVNNAGVGGTDVDADAFKAAAAALKEPGAKVDWSSAVKDNYEKAVLCLQTNYYGAKRMVEAFVPLLQLSHSPRVVNVSSSMGKLKNIPNEWAKGIFTDVENLTEERLDEVLNQYLKDFKEGSKESKGWPRFMSAYTVSKAAMNAYTIVAAKKYHPHIKINSVCPGFVKTDINFQTGTLTVEEGAESIVRLALLPDDGPSGLFFVRTEISPLE